MKYTLLNVVLFVLLPLSIIAQTADFKLSTKSGCSPLSIVCTNTSTGTGSSTIYDWDFGDSRHSSLASPSLSYITPGTYIITLTVKNGSSGTPSVKKDTITVHATPVASFSASAASACPCATISFTNTSTAMAPGGYTSLWSFGDGDVSTLNNPSHLYCVDGVYTVALKVTNSAGCVGSKIDTDMITIYEKPEASFYADKTNLCKVPDSVHFYASASKGKGPYTYSWNFGDGPTGSSLANPRHLYTASGYYTVSLIITDSRGCQDTMTKVDYIKAVPMNSKFDTPASVCPSSTLVLFNNRSTPTPVATKWLWSDGLSSTLTDMSRSFYKEGTLTVRMIDSFGPGCIDTAYGAYTVYRKPKARFRYSPIYPCPAPVNINFENFSDNKSSDTYKWIFGDGSTSTSISPTHTYTFDSVFTVYLVATSTEGCSDTFRVRDTTKEFPNGYPKVTYDSSNSPVIIRVLNAIPVTKIIKVSSHCIPATITCVTSLISTTYLPNIKDTSKFPKCGKIDGYSRPYWYCVESGGFVDPYPDEFKDTIEFDTYYTKIYPYPIRSYLWDFGDGYTSTDAKPTHTFTTEGRHVIKVKVWTDSCSFEDSIIFECGNPSSAGILIGDTAICKNDLLIVTNTSVGGLKYTWDWGDGTILIDSSKTLSHKYKKSGVYKVTIYSERFGCSSGASASVRILPPTSTPKYQINCDNILKVRFMDSTESANRRKWFLGDGDSSTATDFYHTYPDTGIYVVKLITYNDTFGCIDTGDLTLNLYNYTFSFEAEDTNVCFGEKIYLIIDTTQIMDSLVWVSSQAKDSIVYDTSRRQYYVYFRDTGIYTMTMFVSDINHCRDTVVRTNYLGVARPWIKLNASPKLTCFPDSILLKDKGINTVGKNIKNIRWDWDWGDGLKTSTTVDSSYKWYSKAGIYDIKLKVTDTVGCSDSTKITVELRKPKAAFGAALDTFACIGQEIYFFSNAIGTYLKHTWDFGDSTISTAKDPTHAYKDTGTYTVSLIVEDDIGCKDTIVKNAFVRIVKPQALFYIKDSVAICPPLFAKMMDSSVNAQTYMWTFGNDKTSTIKSPTTPYMDTGLYTVRLIVTDKHGCKDTAYKHAHVLGYNGAFKYTPLIGCKPLEVDFETKFDVEVPIMIWDFSDGVIEDAKGKRKTKHIYNQAGAFVPQLLLGDGKGCSASSKGLDTIKVNVVQPKIVHSPACVHESILFTDSSSSLFATYKSSFWRFHDSSTATGRIVTKTYENSGEYPITLISIDSLGCTDTLVSKIKIWPKPNVVAQDTVICLGDKATLAAYGAKDYYWSPDPSLSCTNCAHPITNTIVPTKYYVEGTDDKGCKNKDTLDLGIKTKTTLIYGPDIDVCEKDSMELSVKGAQEYVWTPAQFLSNAFIGNPVARPDSSITYRVIGKEGSCIPDTALIRIHLRPLPKVDAGADQKVLSGTVVQLQAQLSADVTSILWKPNINLSCTDCSNPTAKPIQSTIYIVKATTDFGCSDSDQVRIVVFCDQSQVFLPNSFTPNGDGVNDYFYPQGSGVSKITLFQVYNRWGQKVFENTQANINMASQGWDGRYNGQDLSPDTFVYILEALCDNGEKVLIKGDINLIR